MGRTIYKVVLEGMNQHLGSTTPPRIGRAFGLDTIGGESDDDGSSWWAPVSRVLYVLAVDEDKVKAIQQQMRDAQETEMRRRELAGMKTGVIS